MIKYIILKFFFILSIIWYKYMNIIKFINEISLNAIIYKLYWCKISLNAATYKLDN